jgi:5-formyltetrahydrofolate cyclo-ligase
MGEQLRQLKGALRSVLNAERGTRTAEEIAASSRAVCASVLGLRAFRQARHLVAYAAMPGEIDPAELVRAGMALGQIVYFPRVVGRDLEFLACSPVSLRPGTHGVAEPAEGPVLEPAGADVLFLIPGLGFDPSGARLGRGGGHYDRALAHHPAALRIGLACEAQILSSLPRDPWDQPMDAIVTERRILWTAGRSGAALEESLS